VSYNPEDFIGAGWAGKEEGSGTESNGVFSAALTPKDGVVWLQFLEPHTDWVFYREVMAFDGLKESHGKRDMPSSLRTFPVEDVEPGIFINPTTGEPERRAKYDPYYDAVAGSTKYPRKDGRDMASVSDALAMCVLVHAAAGKDGRLVKAVEGKRPIILRVVGKTKTEDLFAAFRNASKTSDPTSYLWKIEAHGQKGEINVEPFPDKPAIAVSDDLLLNVEEWKDNARARAVAFIDSGVEDPQQSDPWEEGNPADNPLASPTAGYGDTLDAIATPTPAPVDEKELAPLPTEAEVKSWSPSRLRKFLAARGVPVTPEMKTAELKKLIEELRVVPF
jgi:hypothetical protein